MSGLSIPHLLHVSAGDKNVFSFDCSKSDDMQTRSRQKTPVTRLERAGFYQRVLDATSGRVPWILRTPGARPCTLPGKRNTHAHFSRLNLLRVHCNSESAGGRPAVGRATLASRQCRSVSASPASKGRFLPT